MLMMDQPTNPNTYLGLLASLGHRNANENGESATQMTQRQGKVPSALFHQVLLQRKIEEEQARAAALLSLARNVSPDLLALALLRKQQQEQSAVQELQEQFRILEAHQKAAAAPAIAAFGGEAGLGSLAAFQNVVLPTSMTAVGANPLSFPLPPAARMTSSLDESKKNAGAFPRKLHQMLLDLESSDQTHIASFVAGGRAFHIHQPKEFAEKIMPKYFRMGRFSSFQRQLNLYDFQRITDGKHKGGYFHEMFSRSNPVLATLMKRNKIKGKHQTKTQLIHMQRQQQIQQAVALSQQGAAAALPHTQKSHHLVSADASSTQPIDCEGDDDDDCSDASE